MVDDWQLACVLFVVTLVLALTVVVLVRLLNVVARCVELMMYLVLLEPFVVDLC